MGILSVTGCVLSFIAADLFIKPLNDSVVFLKEKDIVLRKEYWRIAINLDVTAYRYVIATIREDLLFLYNQRGDFSAFSDPKQIETLEIWN
jgi:hypothetical protein